MRSRQNAGEKREKLEEYKSVGQRQEEAFSYGPLLPLDTGNVEAVEAKAGG
jgi:hypothetical protein